MKSEPECSNLLTFSTFFIINGNAAVKRFSGARQAGRAAARRRESTMIRPRGET